jgi:hypothetical protein
VDARHNAAHDECGRRFDYSVNHSSFFADLDSWRWRCAKGGRGLRRSILHGREIRTPAQSAKFALTAIARKLLVVLDAPVNDQTAFQI